MTHNIGDPCIGTKDTACVAVCPVDCIHPTKDDPDFEQEEMLYIDPDTCIDCGLCSFVCASKIPIYQYIKLAKYELDRAKAAEETNV